MRVVLKMDMEKKDSGKHKILLEKDGIAAGSADFKKFNT